MSFYTSLHLKNVLKMTFSGIDGPLVKATPLECHNCKEQFQLDKDLAAHLILCSATTRHQTEKNTALFRLGLVPKSVSSALTTERTERTLECDRKLKRFGGTFRGEITTELGRLLLAREDADTEKQNESLVLKVDRECMGAKKAGGRRARQAAITAGNTFVQNVYRRIPGVKKSHITIKLTGAERRFAIRQRMELKRKVREWCKPLKVVIERLTDAELVKYAPPEPPPKEFAGMKKLQVVIEKMSPEEEATLLGVTDPVAITINTAVIEQGRSAKMSPGSEKSDRSKAPSIKMQKSPSSSSKPSPRNKPSSSQVSPASSIGSGRKVMDTSKVHPSNVAKQRKSGKANAENTVRPLFPSRRVSRPAALVSPLNRPRSPFHPYKSTIYPTKNDQGTLFFCRLCGFEQLYEEKARRSIQHHVAVHEDLPIEYKRMHHTIAGVRLLVVEAVQDECIGAISSL